jgi:hypothetical protein
MLTSAECQTKADETFAQAEREGLLLFAQLCPRQPLPPARLELRLCRLQRVIGAQALGRSPS